MSQLDVHQRLAGNGWAFYALTIAATNVTGKQHQLFALIEGETVLLRIVAGFFVFALLLRPFGLVVSLVHRTARDLFSASVSIFLTAVIAAAIGRSLLAISVAADQHGALRRDVEEVQEIRVDERADGDKLPSRGHRIGGRWPLALVAMGRPVTISHPSLNAGRSTLYRS